MNGLVKLTLLRNSFNPSFTMWLMSPEVNAVAYIAPDKYSTIPAIAIVHNVPNLITDR